jgi:OOP family OmpA-OmpF porin
VRRRISTSAVPVLAVVVALAACTADPAGEAGASSSAPAASESVADSTAPGPAEAPAETMGLLAGGAELQADVYPLVRSGDHVVLTVDLSTESDEVFVGDLFRAEVTDEPLADLAAKQVYLPALDAEGEPVGAGEQLNSLGAEGLRVQRVYAAPDAAVSSMGVLLPGGYLDAVPVVDGEVPGPTASGSAGPTEAAGAGEATDLTAVAEAPVLPLESYTAELDGAVRVLESSEEVLVDLGGDVLFDSSAATLRSDAQDAIDAAARRIEERAPGTVEIVGLTDDVGDDASNQQLSVERAQSVADALGERLDTDVYTLTASGQGESEPLVPNTSDENRQLNRRVGIALVSEVTTSTEVRADGEVPPFDDGPTGPGAEGVVIDAGVRIWRYTVPEARRVGDSLVVDLHVTAEDDEVDSLVPGNLAGYWSYRGTDATVPPYMLGLTVLSGASVVYPYDYKVRQDGDTEVWNPLGTLDTQRRIDGGQTMIFTAVYPAFEDADTITVQLNQNLGAEPFRLTEIPVVE